ncbi:MAG: hypothetical protein K6B46_00130 [Opitutales bacterium]|nr:hypothetical protein [Opitutales bacterium]
MRHIIWLLKLFFYIIFSICAIIGAVSLVGVGYTFFFYRTHYEKISLTENISEKTRQKIYDFFPVFKTHTDDLELYEELPVGPHSGRRVFGRVLLTENELAEIESNCFPHLKFVNSVDFSDKLWGKDRLLIIGYYGVGAVFYRDPDPESEKFLYFDFSLNYLDGILDYKFKIEVQKSQLPQ